MPFTCPRCGRTSYHPEDEKQGYCGACHAFTGTEVERIGQLPHLMVSELRVVEAALAAYRESLHDVLGGAHSHEIKLETSHRLSVVLSLQTAVAEAIIHAHPMAQP